MAIHCVSKIVHTKLWTKSGHRRSPMIGPSYDANQPLTDAATGNTIYRKHNDGTVIWHADVVSTNPTCPYGDSTVDPQIRLEGMYNSLLPLITEKSSRFRASFNAALPSEFTREQAIECAYNITKSLSDRFHRPCEFAIHYKKGTPGKKDNIHIHFGLPEWEWENGKWNAKSKNCYINRHTGEYITDGKYYDENGNDVRLPKTTDNAEPIYATDKETGKTVCTNQARGERNKRKWIRRRIDFFTPEQCTWLNDEVDKHINNMLELMMSSDRVQRHSKEVTAKLKKIGRIPRHIGPQSCRTKDQRYHELTAINEEVKRLTTALEENEKSKNNAEMKLSATMSDDSRLIEESTKQEKQLNDVIAEMEVLKLDNSVISYIEKELQPGVMFEREAEDRYKSFLSMKKKMTRPLSDALDHGLRSTNEELAKIKKFPATRRRTARKQFLSRNANMMTTLRNGLQTITEADFTKKIRQRAHRKWNGISGWRKYHYVNNRCGKSNGIIYREYLGLTGTCPKAEFYIPSPLFLPNIKKVQERIQSIANDWQKTMTSDEHLPPVNVAILSEIVSMDAAMTETQPAAIFTLSADYRPTESRRIYEQELQQIEKDEQTEAARKAAEEAARIEAARIAAERAEQERIAREQAEAARKAEAERQKRESIERERREVEQRRRQEEERRRQEEAHRIAEERHRQEEQRRKEEAERLAEQKRIEEQRRAEKEKAASVTVATTQGAATSSQTGIEQRPTKRDYYELSDKVMITKIQIMIDTARATIAAGTAIFRTVSDGIEYYDTHQLVFERDMKSVGLDSATLTQMQSRMKEIWPVVKDEQIERPILVLPQPQPLLSPDQLQIEEDRYQSLLHKAQIQKDAIIENIIPIAILNYMNYENSHRRKYNLSHPEQKRKEYLQYDDAVNELREKLDMHTEVLTEMAKRYGVDISSYTSPIAKAASIKRILDENYTYNNLENRKSRSRTKGKPLQKRTPKERTKNKDKGNDIQANK